MARVGGQAELGISASAGDQAVRTAAPARAHGNRHRSGGRHWHAAARPKSVQRGLRASTTPRCATPGPGFNVAISRVGVVRLADSVATLANFGHGPEPRGRLAPASAT